MCSFDFQIGKIGLTVRECTFFPDRNFDRRQALIVTLVSCNSQAAAAGIAAGDVVRAVGGFVPESLSMFLQLSSSLPRPLRVHLLQKQSYNTSSCPNLSAATAASAAAAAAATAAAASSAASAAATAATRTTRTAHPARTPSTYCPPHFSCTAGKHTQHDQQALAPHATHDPDTALSSRAARRRRRSLSSAAAAAAIAAAPEATTAAAAPPPQGPAAQWGGLLLLQLYFTSYKFIADGAPRHPQDDPVDLEHVYLLSLCRAAPSPSSACADGHFQTLIRLRTTLSYHPERGTHSYAPRWAHYLDNERGTYSYAPLWREWSDAADTTYDYPLS